MLAFWESYTPGLSASLLKRRQWSARLIWNGRNQRYPPRNDWRLKILASLNYLKAQHNNTMINLKTREITSGVLSQDRWIMGSYRYKASTLGGFADAVLHNRLSWWFRRQSLIVSSNNKTVGYMQSCFSDYLFNNQISSSHTEDA